MGGCWRLNNSVATCATCTRSVGSAVDWWETRTVQRALVALHKAEKRKQEAHVSLCWLCVELNSLFVIVLWGVRERERFLLTKVVTASFSETSRSEITSTKPISHVGAHRYSPRDIHLEIFTFELLCCDIMFVRTNRVSLQTFLFFWCCCCLSLISLPVWQMDH